MANDNMEAVVNALFIKTTQPIDAVIASVEDACKGLPDEVLDAASFAVVSQIMSYFAGRLVRPVSQERMAHLVRDVNEAWARQCAKALRK